MSAAEPDRERAWSRETFRSLLESAPDAFVIIDPEGTIALVNAQTEALFSYPREEMLGNPVEMLLPERLRGAHVGNRDSYLAEPRVRPMGAGLDLFGRRKDGSEFPVDISLAPLDTEEGLLLAAAIRDVTERKRLEAVRDEFIHNAAHELRTPLAALSGLGQTLALHMHQMEEGDVQEALEALKRQGERASVLVSNLLDLSQLEGGRTDIKRHPVAVAETVARALETSPPTEGRSVDVEVDDGLRVKADPSRLEQVISNLLTNAYRYGGFRVKVEASAAAGHVILSVSDDGGGVPAELIPNMFEPFTRGKTAGAVGGSGIGLAVSRRIVEALGGSIWYETASPHGARINVQLDEAG